MLDALLKGITLGLLLAISVGPIVFAVIKQSLNNGKAGGFSFIAGISVSDIMLVLFANVFTQFFSFLTSHKKTLAIVASVFLILVGVYYLFFKKVKTSKDGEQVVVFRTRDHLKIFTMGFIMNLFNPGIIIFWLTTATTFLDTTIKERVIIFFTALLLAFLADVAKVVLANKIRKRLTPKNIHRINQLNGLILIGFGVVIILMQR
jgi:threonine/homoserine/homoserine lactone efflux protein